MRAHCASQLSVIRHASGSESATARRGESVLRRIGLSEEQSGCGHNLAAQGESWELVGPKFREQVAYTRRGTSFNRGSAFAEATA